MIRMRSISLYVKWIAMFSLVTGTNFGTITDGEGGGVRSSLFTAARGWSSSESPALSLVGGGTEIFFVKLNVIINAWRKKIREIESCFTCCWWRSFYIIWCCWRRNKYAITTNCKKSGFNVTKSVAESHRCPMFCYIWITIVSIILGSSEKKILQLVTTYLSNNWENKIIPTLN